MCKISIHVPLAGNVLTQSRTFRPHKNFYPRSPCGERHEGEEEIVDEYGFLSTFPLRGTSALDRSCWRVKAISIHVPLAGNVLSPYSPPAASAHISIHVPLAGNVHIHGFLSVAVPRISIHVPLAGNVQNHISELRCCLHFYPRSPCGERPPADLPEHDNFIFLSTFPLRGTSQRPDGQGTPIEISIHVPLAGNVLAIVTRAERMTNFYPRSPCGERRLVNCHGVPGIKDFYPRSPCGERRTGIYLYSDIPFISIHVPLAGNVGKL